MAKKILNIATFGLAGALLGGGGDKKAAEPEPAKPVMPIADDQAVQAAKKRSLMMQLQRGGRESTMLSTDSDTLGG